MATIVLDPNSPIGPQLDAAADGDTVQLPAGVTIPTKKVTFQVAPAVAPTFVLALSVNGVEKAREPVSKGDVVEVRVL